MSDPARALDEATGRTPRQAAAAKAVATKRAATQALARSVPIEIRSLPLRKLLERAIESYNHHSAKRGGSGKVKPNSRPSDVARIAVNYVRHDLSTYHKALDAVQGRVGAADARRHIQARMFKATVAAYPVFAPECARQARFRGVESWWPQRLIKRAPKLKQALAAEAEAEAAAEQLKALRSSARTLPRDIYGPDGVPHAADEQLEVLAKLLTYRMPDLTGDQISKAIALGRKAVVHAFANIRTPFKMRIDEADGEEIERILVERESAALTAVSEVAVIFWAAIDADFESSVAFMSATAT